MKGLGEVQLKLLNWIKTYDDVGISTRLLAVLVKKHPEQVQRSLRGMRKRNFIYSYYQEHNKQLLFWKIKK